MFKMRNLIRYPSITAIRILLKLGGINPLTLAHREMGLLNSNINLNGERNVLDQLVSTNDSPTIFDVGANKGHYSIEALKIIPNAVIHCFEPNNNAFKVLNQIAGLKVNNVAVAENNENSVLYIPTSDTTSQHSTLIRSSLFRKKIIREQQTKTINLDDYCDANNIDSIDLLKIDTEGFEKEVLNGARRILNNTRLIQFEMNYHWVFKRIYLKDFYDILSDFHFFRITGKGLVSLGDYDPKNEIFQMHNILAVHNSQLTNWENS